jgi:hypothetical protein
MKSVCSKTTPALDCSKAARAAYNRRHYIRRKEHRRCVNVDLGEAEISLLVRLKWLRADDAHRPAKIGEAVTALLQHSAKI